MERRYMEDGERYVHHAECPLCGGACDACCTATVDAEGITLTCRVAGTAVSVTLAEHREWWSTVPRQGPFRNIPLQEMNLYIQLVLAARNVRDRKGESKAMSESKNGSGTSFEEAVAAIEGAAPKPASAAAVRAELAPTRALAVQYLDTFSKAVEKHLPFIQAAADKYNLAAKVGIISTELRTSLMQAFTITSGGANAFTGIIEEIDKLKDYDVAMRWHFSIPNRLDAFHNNIGALTRLVLEIEAHLAALEQRVVTTAPVPEQPVMAIHIPRAAPVAVETLAGRDPREPLGR